MTRRLLAPILLLAIAVVPSGCGSGSSASTSPAKAQKVTLVLDWTPNTNHSGVYLAKQKGLYADAGLDVTIIEPDASGALPPLAAGRAEFAFSAAEQLLPARAQGSKLVSVASVMRTNTSSLAAPADRRITRPKDLEGKTYAGFGGELERPLLEALMRCDGGDPTKLKYVEVGEVDYAVGFRKHQYDTVWIFDAWDGIRMREIQKLPISTIPFRDWLQCIPDWYTPLIATREDLLTKHPEMVRTFLAATAKGYQEAAADPQAAANAISSQVGEADPALLAASARYMAPFLTDARGGWGFQEPAVWSAFNAFLQKNRLTTVPDVGAAFTNDFLPTK